MKKKRIVHIITSLKVGGAEALLVDFLSHPLAQHYDHAVIFFHDGPNKARLQEFAIPYFHISGLISCYDPLFFMRLYNAIKTLAPDCLHTWLWSANLAGRLIGRLLGIPVLNSVHSEADMNGVFRNTLDQYTCQYAQRTIAVSYGVAQTLQTSCAIDPNNLLVIKNGINAEGVISKSKRVIITRESLGIDATHFVIGSVGRFIACKNYTLLLEAFALLYHQTQAVHLILVGSGPEKKNLHEHAYKLGIAQNISFIEGQSSYGYYPLFNCFVQTSLKEGISIALLEAMSCSLPVIVTTQQKAHEVITHDHNGILVPSYEPEILSYTIIELMKNRQKARVLGQHAYQTIITDFSLSFMIHAYYTEYRQLINF